MIKITVFVTDFPRTIIRRVNVVGQTQLDKKS